MILSPLTAAEITNYSGPGVIGSSGNSRTVDGWSVPGNATILDGWLNIESGNFPTTGNGSGWDASSQNANFSQGTSSYTTSTHFPNALSLDTNGSFGRVDYFNSPPILQLAAGISTGGTGVTWLPTDLNYSGTPASGGGNTVANGTIPANATEGSFVVATNPNGGVPAGSNAWIDSSTFPLPSPISNFTLQFDHWYHLNTPSNVNGDMDGVWVEYKLDNGTWTWISPVGGYNNTISPSATLPAGANQSANGSHGFPVWAKVAYSGWETSTFELDNLTGINNASNIQFRFRIWTDSNSTARPGWYLDNMILQNIGAGMGFWHHGCYVSTGTCGYSNNAVGVLQLNQPLNLSGISGNPILRTHLEWDLEGSGWDNFCVELSLNNNTWQDISSTTNSTTTACRSRTGAIPGSGYTIGGTTYGDETNALIELDLAIPATYHNQSTVYLRYRVDTDGSVTNGGIQDGQEGLTLDRIRVLTSATNNSSTVFDDHLVNSNSALHYTIGAIDDWNYVIIGAGGLFESYGFEDSQTLPPGGWITQNNGTGDSWEFGQLSSTFTTGPAAWPSGNYGFGIDLDGDYDGSETTHLFSPGYTIPLGASARLTFDQWRQSESGYDGGAVFISVNNGSWQYFDPVLPNGSSWYDGAQNGFAGHILSNLDVFDGRQFQGNVPWETTTADLTNRSGDHLEFRFTFASDSIVNGQGWYLDDIGVEVDYFTPTGSWESPMITLNELGNGFVDVAAITPNGTWVSGTITDSSGNALDGYDNLSFPISLAGIDKDIYPTVKITINMGTNDPFVSPLVYYLHQGGARFLFPDINPQNGWTVDTGLIEFNGTITNPTGTPLSVTSEFISSTAPIRYVNTTGVGTGVTVQLINSQGTLHGNSGLGTMLSFPTHEPGYGVQYTIAPAGALEWATAIGELGQPTLNPEIDVTGDGTTDWSFPALNNNGHYGWQNNIHAAGPNNMNPDSTSATIATGGAASSIELLIPEDGVVNSGMISVLPLLITTNAITMSVASSSSTPWNAGMNGLTYVTLDSSMINAINGLSATYTDANNRNWKQVEIDFTSSGSETLLISSVAIGYSITENLTGLGPQMYAYHETQLTGSIPNSVDIPLTLIADAGALALSGGISHELMITNLPFTAPQTLYPDGQVYEIITRHHHLTDNTQIGAVSLIGTASDGEVLNWSVDDLANGGHFMTTGSNMANLLPSSTVVESGGDWVITWRFDVSWLWDDVDQIDWMSRATNLTGDGLAPAFAISGGPGKNAVENDLQIDYFEVRDEFDRLITVDPSQDFYAAGGSDVTISGTVRFQDNANLRPLTNAYSVGINYSGTEIPATSSNNGSYSLTLQLPANSALATFTPRIVRIGPASGAFGGTDESNPQQTVGLFTDVETPNSEQFQVLTSNGLLDANGHVWDPYQSLTLHLTVTDEQTLGDNVTLHYWREGVDDNNDDGVADENEYLTMARPISMPGRSNEQSIQFTGIDVSSLPANGDLSLYISGTDWAGHSFDNSGSHGLSDDKATMVIGVDTDTILLENSFELNTNNDYLLVGQNHQVSMVIEDSNGINTIDEVIIYMAGQTNAPLGEVHIDPREMTATTPTGSYILPGTVTMESLDEASSRLTLNFALDWSFPSNFRENWMMPGVQVIDDLQTVANVNNIGDLRWNLDNQLTVEIDQLHDLTEPLSSSDPSKLYLGKGDIFAITGTVVYAGSDAEIIELPENLQLYASMVANGVTADVTLDLTEAYFNTTLSVPVGFPSTNSLPVTIDILNIPGVGESLTNTNITLAIDSTPPVAEFPPGVLTSIETDRLSNVDVRINVVESGGMADDGISIHWVYRRGGLNIPGSSGQATLSLESVLGDVWIYSSGIDMQPASHITLGEGDQIAIWLIGGDLAGNDLYGDGTASNPRAPTLVIRIFEPVLSKVEFDQLNPMLGKQVYIQTTIRNNGTTMGSVNVTLVEELDDGTFQIYESHNITDLAPQQKRIVAFSWEAWDSGKPDLYIMWNENENEMSLITPQLDVQEDEVDGGIFGEGSNVGMIIGLLAILVTGVVIAVIAVLMRNRDEWEDEEEWEDAEDYANKMLGKDESSPATSQPSSVPQNAPLPEQAPPPGLSDEEWLESARALLPDWPDEALLTYKENGWTVDQLVEWKNNNE